MKAPFCFTGVARTVGGDVVSLTIVLEVALVGPDGNAVTQWSRWPVVVHGGPRAGRARLVGPYLRQMVYTGTAPEVPPRMYVSSSIDGIRKMLPKREDIDTTPDTWGLATNHVASNIPTVGGFDPAYAPNYYRVTSFAWPTPLKAPAPGPGVPTAGTAAGQQAQAAKLGTPLLGIGVGAGGAGAGAGAGAGGAGGGTGGTGETLYLPTAM